MIIVDNALKRKAFANEPVNIGIIGAGFMAKGIILQIARYAQGIRLVAVSNRTPGKARQAMADAGLADITRVDSGPELDRAYRDGKPAITDNPYLLCESKHIDVIVEVTGAVEFSANVVLNAISNKKHVVLMNAELDATAGPVLNVHAARNGVVLTNADGDQPGVIMNLYRFVKGIGVKPVLCGNIKGLQDPYRNPDTQLGFAQKWGQNPSMVTSFADGSKISFEQTVVANATGMTVWKRGMVGPTVPSGTPLEVAIREYPDEMLNTEHGVVDYLVGAAPGPGVFVIGTHDHPTMRHYLNLYKLGEGPYYCFYTPYHLCHFEVPNTIARAALFGDAATEPLGPPIVEVVACAKRNLRKGERIDGIGQFMTYGVCENAKVVSKENLLPLGIAQDAVLLRDIPADEVLTYGDVGLPEGRLIDKLIDEQRRMFPVKED